MIRLSSTLCQFNDLIAIHEIYQIVSLAKLPELKQDGNIPTQNILTRERRKS
jgi:hypothetical protein